MNWIVWGVIVTLLLDAAVIAGIYYYRRWRAQREAAGEPEDIPIIFPANETARRDHPFGQTAEIQPAQLGPVAVPKPPSAPELRLPDRIEHAASGEATIRPEGLRRVDAEKPQRTNITPFGSRTKPLPPAPAEPESDPYAEIRAEEAAQMAELHGMDVVDGRTIRFFRPDERTVRLLPGRLEVELGEDTPAEIRFVDIPGKKPEVTFGRRVGQPFRHVQLRSLTVSREHAWMAREGNNWFITNLSHTNPIVINGVAMVGRNQKHPLKDGDRIEMGEVIFRYYGT